MPIQTITLTAAGIDTGPLYDVYWSTDCVNYSLLTGSSPVFLPIIGATASIDVPEYIQCIRLVNNNEKCNNFITKNIVYCPTTSTTTASPTTSTTLAPTTTTTTLACTCYTFENTGSTFGGVNYIRCDGFSSSFFIDVGQIRKECIKGGTTPVVADGPIAIYNCNTTCSFQSDCDFCIPTTTTTLAPTTTTLSPTTTTLAPTTTTLAPTTTTLSPTTTTLSPTTTTLAPTTTTLSPTTTTLSPTTTTLAPTTTTVAPTTTTLSPTTTTIAPTTTLSPTTTTVAPTTTTLAPTTTTLAPTTTTLSPTTTTLAPTTTTLSPTTTTLSPTTTTLSPTTTTLSPTTTTLAPTTTTLSPTTTTLSPTTTTLAPTTTTLSPTTTTLSPTTTTLSPTTTTLSPTTTTLAPTTTTLAPTTTTLSPTTTTLAPTTTTLSPTTTTLAPTTTTVAPTTTTTTLPCECWTVVNEDTVSINYTFTDCGGAVSSPNLIAGGRRIHCIEGGSSFIVNSPVGGLLGEYDCEQNCVSPVDCSDCGPTTTTTLAPTTTTLSPTTTTLSPTTTTLSPTTTTVAPTTTIAPTTTTTTAAEVEVFIDNTNSLDVPITDMTINGVTVSYVSGTDFTINAGNNGNFTSTQLGAQDVIIYYGAHTAGQNIVFTDSDNNITCHDLNGSAGSFTISGATITGGTTISVVVSDGACS